MADEETQAAPADADAAPADAGTPAPESKAPPADAGTSLTDDAKAPKAEATGWRDTLPDDLKSWSEKFDSPATALKSYRELEKKLGKSVTLPGKDATPEEVQAFHKKLGVPDSAAEYKLTLPDFVPEEVRKDPTSDPLLKGFIERSHADGKTPQVLQNDINDFYAALATSKEQAVQESARLTQQKLDDLKREWGSDFEANGTFSQRAVKQFDADGRFAEFLKTTEIDGVKVGNHPDFVRFFAKVGRMLAEDSVQLEPTEGEAQNVKDQALKLREQRNAALQRGDRTTAQRLDQQERDLYSRMGNRPIVGTAGRAA